ncbi:hypothetical protein M404DRAFT_991297 [Pisolithus tinctorius Marx 270]|uniref:Uncharacterized protein n=1 Tax=Pisolithus tinctorius Marx 270 TaxID=870435 RepID=A0A0C3PZ00_PISTI|nr:hypothetical protein M404DRAFT_991297 [Pisolithus tinctorius Marx 270]
MSIKDGITSQKGRRIECFQTCASIRVWIHTTARLNCRFEAVAGCEHGEGYPSSRENVCPSVFLANLGFL